MKYLLQTLILLTSHHFIAQQYVNIQPEDVTIKRDIWGIPHIYGNRDVEVAFGLAYANAEDAFVEMQEMFIIAKGLNGKYKGKEGLKTDYMLHALNIPEKIEKWYDIQVSVEFQMYLEAYCQGVNYYAKQNPKEVLMKKIFPITPKEVLQGYAFFIAIESHMDKAIGDILKEEKITSQTIATDLSKGSNGMVISGKLMQSGKTTLMMNPHLPMYGLGSLFEAHLVSKEGLNIHGAVWHGGVSCLLGVNEYLGWTSTTNDVDKNDTYVLEMHPKNKLEYTIDGYWLELEEKKQKLKVKVLGIPITVKKKMYTSVFGPTFITKHGVYSVFYTCYDRIMGAEQYFRMNKATSLEEFKGLFVMQGIPDENFIYGDRKQNIYMMNNAPISQKFEQFNYQELLPGNTSVMQWNSFQLVPSEDMIQYENPSCGYIYNCNHSPQKASSPCYEMPDSLLAVNYFYDWKGDNSRSLTIKQFMQSKQGEKISLEELKTMKYSQSLPENAPILNCYFELMQYQNDPDFSDYKAFFDTYKNWDFNFDKTSKAGTLFTLMTRYIWENTNSGREILYEKTSFDKSVYLDALAYTQKYLEKHFKGEIITLETILKHQRGEKEIGIGGFPDVMTLIYPLEQKDGTLKAYVGENITMFIEFGVDKISMESIVPYGSSNKKESKHFDDQMEMFTDKKLKKVSIYEYEILPTIVKTYHP